MNKVIAIILFSFLFFCSCSTTNKAGTSKAKAESTESDYGIAKSSHYTSLADYLRRNSNVLMQGVEPNLLLQIRGIGSLTSDTRPFIYLDRTPLGRDYETANNAVNPDNIKRIEVISSLSELTRYGGEGHSGIIKIHTKTGTSK